MRYKIVEYIKIDSILNFLIKSSFKQVIIRRKMEAGDEMAVFDGDLIKEQKVKTLVNDVLDANKYEVVWDGKDDSGKQESNELYFYKIPSENLNQTKKIIIIN